MPGMPFLRCIVASIFVQNHRIIGRCKFIKIDCTPESIKNGFPNDNFESAGGTHPRYFEEHWSERLIRSVEKSAALVIVILVSVRSPHEFNCCLSHGQPVLIYLFMQILLFRDFIC